MSGTARLDDPDEHYPYKREHIDALIDANPPAGPAGAGDDSRRVRDLTSPEIAAASDAYIKAQAEHVAEPTEQTRDAYKAAAEALVTARQRHRLARGNQVGIVGVREAE